MRAHSAGTVDSKQARQQSYFSNLLRTLLIDRIYFVFPRYFIRPVHVCMTNNSVRNVQCTADIMSIIIISLWRYGKKLKTRLCLPR